MDFSIGKPKQVDPENDDAAAFEAAHPANPEDPTLRVGLARPAGDLLPGAPYTQDPVLDAQGNPRPPPLDPVTTAFLAAKQIAPPEAFREAARRKAALEIAAADRANAGPPDLAGFGGAVAEGARLFDPRTALKKGSYDSRDMAARKPLSPEEVDAALKGRAEPTGSKVGQQTLAYLAARQKPGFDESKMLEPGQYLPTVTPAPATPAAPAAPAGATGAHLTHDLGVAARLSKTPPAEPAGPVRGDFVAPTADPAEAAARAAKEAQDKKDYLNAQYHAAVNAGNYAAALRLDRAMQMMTWGENRFHQDALQKQLENTQQPVVAMLAAQQRAREAAAAAQAAQDKKVEEARNNYKTNTDEAHQRLREKSESIRDAETTRHNRATEAGKLAEIRMLSEKQKKEGAVPNYPPVEAQKVEAGAKAPAAAAQLAKAQAEVGPSGVWGALVPDAMRLGADRRYHQLGTALAPQILPEDQRDSPQAIKDFVSQLPPGTQDAGEAAAALKARAAQRLQNAEERHGTLRTERYNPAGIQALDKTLAGAHQDLESIGKPEAPPAAAHPEAAAALEYARTHPNDPDSAEILRRLGK